MGSNKAAKLADLKRSHAKKIADLLFKIPEGVSSNVIDELVDDIISAAVLEVKAMQLGACEKNYFDDFITNTGKLKRRIKNEL